MKTTKLVLAITVLFATLTYGQTLTLQPGAEGKDAYVVDKYPTVNYEAYPNYEAEAWTSSGGFLGRCLVEFDLAGLPAGATIVSANLSLYYAPQGDGDQHSTLSGSNSCLLQRITQPWTESLVTWTNQPMTTTSNQAVLAQSITNTQDYANIDVKAMLEDELAGGGTSLGIMIKLATEVYYRRMVFASSDYATAAKHPKLVIVYTTGASIEEYSTDFSVFPNPCHDQLILSSVNGELLSNIQGIEIYDLQGSLVSSPQNTSGPIDVSKLNSGIYILKINYGLKSEYVRFTKA